MQAVGEGRSPLVLTERSEHLDRFESELSGRLPHVVALRGGLGKKQRQAAADRLTAIPPSEGRVILATGKYIGEGFDDPRLDTLFLTLPVSWRGTIAQYVGRLHRPCQRDSWLARRCHIARRPGMETRLRGQRATARA